MKTALKADQSFQQRQELVTKALREARGVDLYIVELYDDKAVYEEFGVAGADTKTWEVPYTVEAEVVTFGDRVEVKREVRYLAVKRSGADSIEGLAIPFGYDVDGESFTPDTDFCIDWFGKAGRPFLFDHGLDSTLKSQVMGRQVDFETRAEGLWAQVQLDRNVRYRKALDQLIDEEAIGFSSGAMPHLATKNKKGEITRWPWVELSGTPIPAHPGALNVHFVKSAELFERFEAVGTEIPILALKALASWADDRDAAPDTESLDDKAGRVSAAIDEFRGHARAAAAMRTKAGRILSAANRERIAKAIDSKSAVLAAYADLEALLTETDPAEGTKGSDAIRRELLAYQALEARLNGVELPKAN